MQTTNTKIRHENHSKLKITLYENYQKYLNKTVPIGKEILLLKIRLIGFMRLKQLGSLLQIVSPYYDLRQSENISKNHHLILRHKITLRTPLKLTSKEKLTETNIFFGIIFSLGFTKDKSIDNCVHKK